MDARGLKFKKKCHSQQKYNMIYNFGLLPLVTKKKKKMRRDAPERKVEALFVKHFLLPNLRINHGGWKNMCEAENSAISSFCKTEDFICWKIPWQRQRDKAEKSSQFGDRRFKFWLLQTVCLCVPLPSLLFNYSIYTGWEYHTHGLVNTNKIIQSKFLTHVSCCHSPKHTWPLLEMEIHI